MERMEEHVVTKAGSYLRLMNFCITQLKAQGPSRTCNESKEEEEEEGGAYLRRPLMDPLYQRRSLRPSVVHAVLSRSAHVYTCRERVL